MNVGFIGLGIMGRPMAANLLPRATLYLSSRSGVPAEFNGKATAAPMARRSHAPPT
jgi:3-hydroxyisobutyrate dehydrogenase-like beta-hydroxyacid dehydrogenase